MALQKKKRNVILKSIWKKIQIKKLANFNISVINKKLELALSSIKNIFNNDRSFKLHSPYRLFKFKTTSLSLFKEFDWLNFFSYDRKVVKYCLHKANSGKLIEFLISFFDNIVRDSTSIFNKNYSDGNSYVCGWKLKDLRIITNKIKKTLKFFFYFIDYHSISGLSFFLVSYNYFKLSLPLKLNCLNFLHSFKKFSNFHLNKAFKFDYLLINKIINKNYLIRYSNNEWFQKSYKNAYALNKINYVNFLKTLKLAKFAYVKRGSLHCLLLRLKNVSGQFIVNNDFIAINFFHTNLFYLKKSLYYQKFLINKIYFNKNNQKNKNFIKKIAYIKNFSYFKDDASSKFYHKSHLNDWDDKILNIFNYKIIQEDLKDYVKRSYLIFQNNYFVKLLWSWHLVFINNNLSAGFSLKFFNFKCLSNSISLLFYSIYKLRAISNYLFFVMLPLNFNLVWSEIISKNKSLFRANTLNIISKKINKSNWFYSNNTVFKKIKNFVVSKLSRNVLKTKKYAKVKFIKAYYKSVVLLQKQQQCHSKKIINFSTVTATDCSMRSNFKSCLNSQLFTSFFKFKMCQNINHGRGYLLKFLVLKNQNQKSSQAFHTVNLYNNYCGSVNFLFKKFKTLPPKSASFVSYASIVSNNNFVKKNSYNIGNVLTKNSLFSVINSTHISSRKVMADIKLPSCAYQNIMLFNVVKNKELLYQVSYIYEFESLMFDLKLSVHLNKLKKTSVDLSYIYNNLNLLISNVQVSFVQILKVWFPLINKNYLYFTSAQLYFLSKLKFSKSLLFV